VTVPIMVAETAWDRAGCSEINSPRTEARMNRSLTKPPFQYFQYLRSTSTILQNHDREGVAAVSLRAQMTAN